jgi:hypothetical protein
VYFDNPSEVINKDQTRYAVGIKVPDKDINFFLKFMEPLGYKLIKLPPTPTVYVYYMYR